MARGTEWMQPTHNLAHKTMHKFILEIRLTVLSLFSESVVLMWSPSQMGTKNKTQVTLVDMISAVSRNCIANATQIRSQTEEELKYPVLGLWSGALAKLCTEWMQLNMIVS